MGDTLKLNNKGFAISSIMYIILVLATILIIITLSLLSSRKLILDKLKDEVLDNIKYSEILSTLKEEAIMYARENSVEKDSIQISNLESSIDSNTLKKHNLLDKYITMVNKNSSYDVYLGKSKTISDINNNNTSFIDIIDYKISGNSYQYTRDSRNLIPFPYATTSNTKNGVTYTVNDDGSIHVSGTATANATFILYYNTTELPSGVEIGKDYTISLTYNKPSVSEISVTCNYFKKDVSSSSYYAWINASSTKNNTKASPDDLQGLYCYLVVLGGSTVEGTVYPQLELGTQVTEYTQYGKMPSPDFESEINSVGNKVTIDGSDKYEIPITTGGKNLFDTKNAKKYSGFSVVKEQSRDKIVVGQDVTSTWHSANFPISEDLVGKTVTISADVKTSGSNVGRMRVLWMDTDSATNLGGLITDSVSSTDEFVRVSMTGVIPENTTENNYKLCLLLYSHSSDGSVVNGVDYTVTYKNIQIELGEEVTNYEPYAETKKITIYIDEPLRCLSGQCDSINFANQKTEKKVGLVDLGILNWSVPSGYSGYMYYTPKLDNMDYKTNPPLGLSTIYKINTASGGWDVADLFDGITINEDTGEINVRDVRFLNNAENLKTALNGVYFNYGLTNPAEQIIDLPKIEVDEGANIIKIGTDIQPSNVEFTVIEKIKKL